MGGRPNIFKYATKELSQDAMICWFLACLKSEDEFYKAIGVKFVRFILDDEKIKDKDIRIDSDTPHAQYYHMDVYAVLCVENKAIPIIFEDKTDTYLHSDQMQKYCDTVNRWKNDEEYLKHIKERSGVEKLEWGDTRYFYFKTGYVPKWQKNDIKKEENKCENVVFKNIYIDEWIEFLSELPSEDLIGDYIEHLKEKKQQNEEGKFAKWDKIMQKIFEDGIAFHYDHQGWASKDILVFNNGKDTENLWYSLRCGSWQYGEKGKYCSAIALQQYRNEKNSHKNKDFLREERIKNAEQIKEICRGIFDELKTYNFDECEENPKSLHSQNNIFKIFFTDEQSETMCGFFNKFVEMFVERVISKYENVEDKR